AFLFHLYLGKEGNSRRRFSLVTLHPILLIACLAIACLFLGFFSNIETQRCLFLSAILPTHHSPRPSRTGQQACSASSWVSLFTHTCPDT
ncbi:hypothetical protein GQ54DRAFT_340483, partial [Martensiomyces pterosporus]